MILVTTIFIWINVIFIRVKFIISQIYRFREHDRFQVSGYGRVIKDEYVMRTIVVVTYPEQFSNKLSISDW